MRPMGDESADRMALAVAELARSILAGASSVLVGSLHPETEVGRHAVLDDGTVVFEHGAETSGRPWFAGEELPARHAQVVAVDVAPVPLADRVRGEVIMVGELVPLSGPLDPAVHEHLLAGRASGAAEFLAFTPRKLLVRSRLLAHLGGIVPLEEAHYRRARPDPLVTHEGDWLVHLDRGHADVLDLFARAAAPTGVSAVARPLRLDRGGVVVHVSTPSSAFDVRFDFVEPVRCGCDLAWAFEDLVDRLEGAPVR